MLRRVAEQRLQMGRVLEPSSLGDHGQVAAEFARPGAETLAKLVHRQGGPFGLIARIDRFALCLPGLGGHRDLIERRAFRVDGQLLGDLEPPLDPYAQVGHQISAVPAMNAVQRALEFFVGQLQQRLKRPPGIALFVQE